MIRKMAALVLILVAAMLVYMLVPIPSATLTKEQATRLIMDDLTPLRAAGAYVELLSVEQSDGGWDADARVAFNPHSKCPTVQRRDYTLVPFGFRPEETIRNCSVKTPVVYREEALIDSGKLPEVAALGDGARGCAFYLQEYAQANVEEYCPWLDDAEFASFSAGLPRASWVCYWENNGAKAWVALDQYNRILKQG
ncbi:hypothetical protein COT29_03645 [Candidatus Micrarchaeota archaeon CG08_land_8_20_14_0_20_59_11]|nr:MAG: hypothetical protein COT29_03645 [Candidatus Micrarchaeota archaeon CG08_land_8_20_14_0_20_59_11]